MIQILSQELFKRHVDVALRDMRLDLTILKVFSNLNGSMIL